jgi:carboxylate-amine ligase
MAAAGAPRVRAHVAGPDLVRGPDGGFRVLEDNMRAPSGFAYLLAAREAIAPLVLASGLRPRGLDDGLTALREAFRSAAPDGVAEPTVALLSDGPGSGAWFEHRELAARLELALVTVEDLEREGDRLLVAAGGGRREQVDVVYRRLDDEALTGEDGEPTPLGDLLTRPLLAGTLGCVNSPGSGVADDKAVHVYAERMIGFYLGEEPAIPSVPAWDLGDPAQLALVSERLGELVLKPRSEFGGSGVFVGPLAPEAERRAAAATVLAQPERYVAQEPVALSVHPTVVDGELRSRHVDLRPFVFSCGDEVRVLPGGLTRFAREEGEMVVNSGQGGGAKDTWILIPQNMTEA